MLSEPRVDRAALVDAVRTSYGIAVDSLRFIPVGWASVCYQIDQRYFLKLWLTPDDAAQAVARLPVVQELHDSGFRARVPYPVATLDGRLSVSAAGGVVALFPFLPGTTPAGWPRWSDDVLDELGRVLTDLHAVTPPLDLPREDFAITGLVPNRRLAQLQSVVRRLPQRLVLCHTDLIGDNLLVDSDGRLSALDWDTAMLAPPECDLALLLQAEQPVDAHALRRVLAIYPADVPLELDLFAFFLLRRYVADCSARVMRLQESGLSAADADEARAGMVTWGSAQWSRLDRTLDLVRSALAERGA
ncbi:MULTISPECIES: phosphotransferase enzyme family protein [unclassified Kribbella]|uniref:phosphotransferase enzyme family protein n=1 Tax=unclassified Kribbella TaxID=2644121 RepID=UPI0030198989